MDCGTSRNSVTVFVVALVTCLVSSSLIPRPGVVRHANRADTYLAVVIPASANPAHALEVLGLPARCQAMVGANWYKQRGENLQVACPEVFSLSSAAFLRFASAWLAQRAGDPAAAERHYRRVLTMWPNDDRVLNNLGNTLASVGRSNEALEFYGKAAEANPKNAAARFNASQIYTLNFDFPAATIELERASALDFELVRTYQSQGTADGMLPLVDQWLKPHTLWLALWRSKEPGAAIRRNLMGWQRVEPFRVAIAHGVFVFLGESVVLVELFELGLAGFVVDLMRKVRRENERFVADHAHGEG